jgi:CO/xanthine dehydrogenase FAD-binding subunit
MADSDEACAGATLGQCLGNEAPSADLVLPLICLGASVAIFGPHGWSEMTLEALCGRGHGTALQRGEFLVDVRVPAPPARSGGAYVRSAPGEAGGEAASAGAFLVMQDDLKPVAGRAWPSGRRPGSHCGRWTPSGFSRADASIRAP